MHEESIEVPDVYGVTYGFKKLKYHLDANKLTSAYQERCLWWPGQSPEMPKEAECKPASTAYVHTKEPHDVPSPDPCMAGFYSHYTLEGLEKREPMRVKTNGANGEPLAVYIWAVMEGWGRIEAHDDPLDGWRSQFARIRAIVHINDERVEERVAKLADALGVPYLSREDAQAYAETLGVCLMPGEDSSPDAG